MIKKITLSGVGILMLASPLFASADVLSNLQAQIQALLAQIATLKAQMGVSGGVSTSGTSCISLTNSLSVDDTDADNNGEITKLQTFLARDASIYPEGLVTGYFGPATMRAVQRWQKVRGVVSSGTPDTTGYGFVGSRTRAAMACGSQNSASNTGSSNTTQTQTSVYTSTPTTNTNTPSITFSSISSGNVIGSFANLPANSQIRFVNASTGQRYDAQSTMVWSGGSGPLSITVPNDLPNGTYYLRATDYYNPNTTIAQSGSFQAGANVQTNSVVISSFTASPTSVNVGGAVMFMWSSNLTATDVSYYGGGCSIEGITQNNVTVYVTSGFKGASGQITFVPPATATYTLRCTSNAKDGSPSASKQITVNVAQPQTNPVTISSFNASQTSVSSGQPVTFTWNSNLTSNDISYYGGGCGISALTSYNQQIHLTSGASSGASGSVTYTPALTATYTLTCIAGGKDGSPMATKQVTVPVN